MNNALLFSNLIQNPIPEPSISPKIYRSFLASFSSLLVRILQSISPIIIFPISSTLLPILSSTQLIQQNSNPKAIKVFSSLTPNCQMFLGITQASSLVRMDSDLSGVLQSWHTFSLSWHTFSFSLSPQRLFKIPLFSKILHSPLLSYTPSAPHSQFFLSQ